MPLTSSTTSSRRRPQRQALAAILSLCAGTALASPLEINLSSEASRPAANDLMQATVSAEASGTTPAELAKGQSDHRRCAQVDQDVPAINAQSGGDRHHPSYAKGGTSGRGACARKSRSNRATQPASPNSANCKVRWRFPGLRMLPSPETRRKADAAILDALAPFKAFQVAGGCPGKSYGIKELLPGTSGQFVPPVPVMRQANRMMSSTCADADRSGVAG